MITDSTSIANIFNSYFIDRSANDLASLGECQEMKNALSDFSPLINIEISPVTETDVLELLMSIPSHKATGDDGIGIKILKIAAFAIVPSLTRVLNLCLTRKYFPRRWKIAKVSSIFKGNGCKNEKECFSPISVLPTLSKLLEKLIGRSLNNILNGNNILYKFQSGFRKDFSTETALIRLVDQLLLDLDQNRVSGLAFRVAKSVQTSSGQNFLRLQTFLKML